MLHGTIIMTILFISHACDIIQEVYNNNKLYKHNALFCTNQGLSLVNAKLFGTALQKYVMPIVLQVRKMQYKADWLRLGLTTCCLSISNPF